MLVRWGIAAALTCVLFVSVSTAHGQDAKSPKQVAAASYKEARAQFRSGEYDDALAAVEAGLAAVPEHLQLLLIKGQILLEKRDYDGAISAYEAFLAAGPRGANKRKARKIIQNLGVVRSTFLVVTVENGPADVYVDSKTMGLICVANPTCKKGYVPGSYQIIIERSGFEPVRERVTLTRGQLAELTRTLVEKPSQLVVRVTPVEASLTVDGKPAVSGTAQEVTAGKHAIEASLDGYATHALPVTAAEGKPIEIDIALSERLVLDLKPPDATVLLDGTQVKVTGGAITLPPGATGPLQITARKAGFRDRVIDVPADRAPGTRIPIELEPLPAVVEPEPEPGPTGSHDEWTATKISLVSVGGAVALTGLVVASVSAGNARSHQNDAERLCEPDDLGLVCPTDEGFEATVDAKDAAGASNVFLGLGVVGAVGALVAYTYNEPPSADGTWSTRRKVSFGATAGVAAVGLTTSVLYGLGARDSWDESEQFCDANGACNRRGFIAGQEADEKALVANVGFVVASVAAAGAVYLWLTAPDSARPVEQDVSVGASIVPGGGGVSVRARF